MKLRPEIQDPQVTEVQSSESLGEGLFEWWNRAHEVNHRWWLSGTPGEEVWDRLEVKNFLSPGAQVLEVGVGLGLSVQALVERGCQVSVLDISPVALKRVSSVAQGYLSSELQRLPINTFDVAMSHLVSQHMTDHDLEMQITAVVASLKPTGVFAIQFSSHLDGLDHPHDESSSSTKGGGVLRSPDEMKKLSQAAQAVKLIEREKYPQFGSRWYVLHLKRRTYYESLSGGRRGVHRRCSH